jgi:electron transfer flavoprotein alpha subunit
MVALVVAEHSNSALNEATHKAVSAASALGGPVHVLVAGQNAGGNTPIFSPRLPLPSS